MKSVEDKLYIKVVDLQKIHNFVVDEFFIWNHLWFQNSIWSSYILKFKFFEMSKQTQMEKQPKLILDL
jgi:hypothetical protein